MTLGYALLRDRRVPIRTKLIALGIGAAGVGAINYYRTILGIGVSLMTMLLIVGIGINFLQNLVSIAGQTPDIPCLAAIMAATILLAVIVHKLLQMVANIALGSGHNGAVGSVGIMAMIGAGIAGSSIGEVSPPAGLVRPQSPVQQVL